MIAARAGLTRRVLAALEASPSRIPVVLGGCGTGRSTLLRQVLERSGRLACQSIDVERTATTPERFLCAVSASSPFTPSTAARDVRKPLGARLAFDATLAFLDTARVPGGGAATFLLDEFLDVRTFESFPGLRRALPELTDALAHSGNRFVLTSRYVSRTLRTLGSASPRFEVMHMPPLAPDEVREVLGAAGDQANLDHIARAVHALADGRPVYVRTIADELATMRNSSATDPVSALASLLAPGGRLSLVCASYYELRLHRARGYGALKAILEILAEDEPLTLTEIAQRLQRTPGSTKDYLSWLEDVDLVVARQKRYSFADPLLRTWVRLYCRPALPTEEDLVREIHRYALPRLPQAAEPALALAGAGTDEERREWGIIEID